MCDVFLRYSSDFKLDLKAKANDAFFIVYADVLMEAICKSTIALKGKQIFVLGCSVFFFFFTEVWSHKNNPSSSSVITAVELQGSVNHQAIFCNSINSEQDTKLGSDHTYY